MTTWSYAQTTDPGEVGLEGFEVVAEDGPVGVVESASHGEGDAYVVVEYAGSGRMIPAGKVRHIDADHRRIFVDLAIGQVESAPVFDATRADETDYRQDVEDHYSTLLYR